MGSFIDGLKHAFALGPGNGGNDALPACLERLAEQIVERRMEVPAMVVLETLTPLNFLAAQGAAALMPLLSAVMDVRDWEEAAVALEDRGTLRRLIERIETLSRGKEASV